MLKVALPAASVPAPRSVAPLKKFTVPGGVPAVEVTVAVSVTGWPNVEGFGAEVNVVVVGAGFTNCASTAEVEPAKLAEPA